MIDLRTLVGKGGNGVAINSQGDVVGQAQAPTDKYYQAFLYSKGS